MADEEHLQILKQGVKTWNRWRRKNREIKPDLRGAFLYSAELSDANLSHADLSEANLIFAKLRRVNLIRANLTCTELAQASLVGANLTGALLAGTILRKTILWEVNFRGAALLDAKLTGALMERANFKDTVIINTGFYDASLGDTVFSNTDLSKVRWLDCVRHTRPSEISISTIVKSGGVIPEVFLRGCGVPESFIVQIPSLITAMQPIQFYSCFISYSSKDQEFAERLYADLQAKGVRVWFAPHDMAIGARIRPTIDESIRIYDKLLLVLSETSVDSQWVEQEVETALEKERESTGRTVLFPIRIDDAVMRSKAGWPALIKNSRNIGDFQNWKEHDSYTKAFERLLRDLKATANQRLE